MKVLKESPADPASVQAVEKDNELIERTLRMKYAKRRYEVMRAAGDETAPGVVRLLEDWQAEEKGLEKLKQEKLYAVEGLRRTEEAKKLVPEWQEAERTIKRLAEQLAESKGQLAKAEKTLRELPAPVAQAGFREDNTGPGYSPAETVVKTEDGVLSSLVKQYLLTKMELDSPQRVRVLQKGSTPMQKDLKKQVIGTVAGGLMGFGLIALGVLAFETVSRRVSSLADLKSAGPCPVVGRHPVPARRGRGQGPGQAGRGQRGDRPAPLLRRPDVAVPRGHDRGRHQPARRRGQGVHRVRPGQLAGPGRVPDAARGLRPALAGPARLRRGAEPERRVRGAPRRGGRPQGGPVPRPAGCTCCRPGSGPTRPARRPSATGSKPC